MYAIVAVRQVLSGFMFRPINDVIFRLSVVTLTILHSCIFFEVTGPIK